MDLDLSPITQDGNYKCPLLFMLTLLNTISLKVYPWCMCIRSEWLVREVYVQTTRNNIT